MRISLSTATFYHRSLAYSARLARDADFDGVELAIGPEYLFRRPAGLARVAHDLGTPILSVHPPFVPLPGWPLRLADHLDRLVDTTLEAGAPVLVLHAPLLRREDSPGTRAYARAIERARARADGKLRICIESLQYSQRPHVRYLFDDLATLVRFARERGCGVTFDTTHAGANGEDLLTDYEIVRPALGNVHLSDAIWRDDRMRTHVPPGEGALPLRAFLSALARDGYDGPVTLEVRPNYVGYFGRPRHLRRMRGFHAFVRGAVADGLAEPATETHARSPTSTQAHETA